MPTQKNIILQKATSSDSSDEERMERKVSHNSRYNTLDGGTILKQILRENARLTAQILREEQEVDISQKSTSLSFEDGHQLPLPDSFQRSSVTQGQ